MTEPSDFLFEMATEK